MGYRAINKFRAAGWLMAAALLPLAPEAAFSQTEHDVRAGQALARQWCANCHTIDARQRQATDAAPTLPSVGRRAALGDEKLRTWLSTPHAGMPDFSLTRAEIDALIAYLASFRK